MSTSDKVKAMMALTGKKQMELAAEFGMSKQAMSNKLAKDSWPTKDLVKAVDFCSCKLAIILPDGQMIYLDNDEKSPDA